MFCPVTYCLNISAALGMVSSQERSYKLAEWILVTWLIFLLWQVGLVHHAVNWVAVSQDFHEKLPAGLPG